MRLVFAYKDKDGLPCPEHDKKIIAANADVFRESLEEFAEEIAGNERSLPFEIPVYTCYEGVVRKNSYLFINQVNLKVIKMIVHKVLPKNVYKRFRYIACEEYQKEKC